MLRWAGNIVSAAASVALCLALVPSLGTTSVAPEGEASGMSQQAAIDAGESSSAGNASASKDAGGTSSREGEASNANGDGSSTSSSKLKDAGTIKERIAPVSKSAAKAVREYFNDRTAEVAGKGTAAKDGSISLAGDVQKASEQRCQGMQAMAASGNFTVEDVDSNVFVTDVEQDGDEVQVDAYELVSFTYDDLADGEGGSDEASFGTFHTMSLTATDSGSWEITQDQYDESDLCGVKTVEDEDEDAAAEGEDAAQSQDAAGEEAAEDAEASSQQAAENSGYAVEEEEAAGLQDNAETSGSGTTSGLKTMATTSSANYCLTYDTQAACKYADKYALSYNTSYYNCNPVGGDCANFTSQSIYAGGMPQVKGNYDSKSAWWSTPNKKSLIASASWVNCTYFVPFFKKHGVYVKNPSSKEVFPGSPVVYAASSEWSHATICVGYNSAGTAIIDAHNSDRYHMPYTYWNTTRCTVQLTQTAKGNSSSTFSTNASGSYTVGAVTTSTKRSFTWKKTGEKKVELIGFEGTAAEVVIPKRVTVTDEKGKVSKYKVRSIGASAFSGNDVLAVLSIPESVHKIGESAFANCTSLAQVTGAENVASIANKAFMDCSALEVLPDFDSVTKVGVGSFYRCTSITALPAFSSLVDLGAASFYGCTGLRTARLASPVLTTMGIRVFSDCTSLLAVNILSTKVTSIPERAFRGCVSLNKVFSYSENLKSIGAYAFYCAKSLDLLRISSKTVVSAQVAQKAFQGINASAKVRVAEEKVMPYKMLFRSCALPKTVKVQAF